MAFSKNSRATHRNAFTIVELLVVLAVLFLLVLFFAPMRRGARPAAMRTQSQNNLKNIAVALFNYHLDQGSLPPACTFDADGRPLHSWRTLLLPYLEQTALYEQIDLTKPWDDPANQQAFETHIPIFACPAADIEPNQTSYMVVVNDAGYFPSTSPDSFPDCPANTLLVVEVPASRSVPWMAPQDLGLDLATESQTWNDLSFTGGWNIAFADGRVRFVSSEIMAEMLDGIITIDGGEDVSE